MADDDRDTSGDVRFPLRELLEELRRDILGLRDEIRQSRHDLANKLATVVLRVDKLEYQQLDTLRRLDENDGRAATWIPRIEHLLQEETLSQRVTKDGWTRRERLLAYGLFVFAFVGAVGTVISLIVLID